MKLFNKTLPLVKKSLVMATAAATLATGQAAFAENTVVELYTWRVQDEALFNYINEKNLIPGVQVHLNVYTEDIESKLRIDMQTNRPDLYHAKAGSAWMQPWIDAGVAAPVSDLGIDLSAFGEAALAGATGSDGKVYGVPFVMQMESILYNKAVFDGAPTNLDELEAAFAELKDQGIVPMHVDGRDGWYLNQVLHETILAGMTSDQWAQDVVAGEACFTDDIYVDAMARFKSWQDEGYLNPNPLADDYGAMRTGVALGTSAMMIDGIWSATPASPMYQIDPSLELGFMAIPGSANKVYGFTDAHLAYNPNSDDIDAVKKVLEFYTTPMFAQLFADMVEAVPASNHPVDVNNARVQAAAEMISNDSLAAQPFFHDALISVDPGYRPLVSEGMQELLAGEITPRELAEHIQKGLNDAGYIGASHCAL
ncbi:ABC transporter substrate-binding protein [Saccharospirillum mangrovi]|uniref:ABC transporter substrate-binding protein n=1 Tax=Saccharospirillum mangrovi TaxID=2161747 RepID=UPI000D3C07EB|nr:extracellular solute-binding protein [Saccharospirillum mangrovi]